MAVGQVLVWGLAIVGSLAIIVAVIGWTVVFVCGIQGMSGRDRIDVIKAMAVYLRAFWPIHGRGDDTDAVPIQGYIFISYSRQDGAYVNRLVRHLERGGLAVWADHNVRLGERWRRVIRQKIDECCAVVVVMTPDAETSDWVEREITRAERRKKPILPLLLAGDPFMQLDNVQYESVRGGRLPTRAFSARLRALTGSQRA